MSCSCYHIEIPQAVQNDGVNELFLVQKLCNGFYLPAVWDGAILTYMDGTTAVYDICLDDAYGINFSYGFSGPILTPGDIPSITVNVLGVCFGIGECIPPTQTATHTITPTPTLTPTITKCACNGYEITISQSDLDNATGNLNPDLNGTVFWVNIDCDGVVQNTPFENAGTFYGYCACQETGFVHYNNNNQVVSLSSSILLGDCIPPSQTPTNTITQTKTPTQTPTNTQTPTLTKTPTVTPTTTSIICGSGITQSGYYYTDCCGNFVKDQIAGQVVVLDYTLPNYGITLLNVPASQPCLTQTPTPTTTPTVTPTLTPTKTPTQTPTSSPTKTPTATPIPSCTPEVTSVNECVPITILDMGVSCNVIKQPSSNGFDGILSVIVTGGTPPYSFYWSTGENSQTIYNLPFGNYSVLVVDYWGDYSAVTTCSLIRTTPTQTPTKTPTQTPTTSMPVTNLCFKFIFKALSTEFLTFVPAGAVNGKPSWYNSSRNYTVAWSNLNNRWEILGWNLGGTPISTTTNSIPLTGWIFLGTPGSVLSITVTQGSCPVVAPLTYTFQTQSASCQGVCDGSLIVSATGGVPPYLYSIDGTNFQTSNIFNSLCSSTFGLTVKDSVGTSLTQTVTIGNASSIQQYVVRMEVIDVRTIANTTKICDWKITTLPPLPVGLSIVGDVVINVNQNKQGPFYLNNPDLTIAMTATNSVNVNGVSQPLNLGRPLVNTIVNTCNGALLTGQQTNYTETLYNLTLTNSTTSITGSCVSFIDILNSVTQLNCVSNGTQNIDVTLANFRINNVRCYEVITDVKQVGVFNHNVSGPAD